MTTRHRIARPARGVRLSLPSIALLAVCLCGAASALRIALATFVCGRLTSFYGERTYLAMAGLVMAGLVLALFAALLKRRIET